MGGVINTEENPEAANRILAGSSTTAGSAQTLITIPAGRVWKGSVSATIGAAAITTQYTAIFNTAGTGVTPAAAVNLFAVSTSELTAASGESNVNGTSGEIHIAAPLANSVTLTVTATSGAAEFSASAVGILLNAL